MRSLPLAVAVVLAFALSSGPAQERPASKRLFIAVGQTVRLQLSHKQPIHKVFNERPQIAVVAALENDPTMVLVTGLSPGWTRITLIGADGKEEVWEPGPKPR